MQYILLPIFFPHFRIFLSQDNPKQLFFHLFNKKRVLTLKDDQNISFNYILLDHTPTCFYRWRDFSFVINSCFEYPKGSVLRLFGSIEPNTANQFFAGNRLNVQSIVLISEELISAKSSFYQYVLFLQKISLKVMVLRDYLLAQVSAKLSFVSEQLVRAMVFGDRSKLTPQLRHYFEVTGMLHVLAVSGMHVGLLYLLVRYLTSRFWMNIRIFTQVGILSLYAFFVGLGPSVLRAAGMLIFVVVLRDLLGRQTNSWLVLSVVVAGLSFVNPWYLKLVGAQLSVAATASILLLNSIKKRKITQKRTESNWQLLFATIQEEKASSTHNTDQTKRKYLTRIIEYVKEITVLSIVIQALLAPLLWVYFEKVSIIGPIAAPASMWLVPPLFVFSVLFLIVVSIESLFIWLAPTGPIGFLFHIFIDYMSNPIIFLLRICIDSIAILFITILESISTKTESFAFVYWSDFSLESAFYWYFGVGLIGILLILLAKYKSTVKIYFLHKG